MKTSIKSPDIFNGIDHPLIVNRTKVPRCCSCPSAPQKARGLGAFRMRTTPRAPRQFAVFTYCTGGGQIMSIGARNMADAGILKEMPSFPLPNHITCPAVTHSILSVHSEPHFNSRFGRSIEA
jgi:hypothetical protein